MDISNLIFLVTEAGQAATEAAHTAESADGGVIGTLGLNWKLFLAQLINFLVVLFVLWKFVFKPVGGALEARRVKIEESIRNAEEVERRMQETHREREKMLADARKEADEVIKTALGAASQMKTETAAAARIEGEKIMETARETIDSEREKMLREVREEVAGLVVMASERIIGEKLDAKKDRELISKALEQVK